MSSPILPDRSGHDLPFSDPLIQLVAGSVTLSNLTKDQAEILGLEISHIDPWAKMNYPANLLIRFLKTDEPSFFPYALLVEDRLAGVVVIKHPWLHGPYLNLLAVLPPFQGKGIGAKILNWMEEEVRGKSRNLWVIASKFNIDAMRFYERHGFQKSTEFEGLVKDGFTEILFRKTLF